MTPEDYIVSELAEVVCKRIAWQTRMALTKLADCRLSGEDSPLKNSWEEICVQCQGRKSIFWPAYEDTIRGFIRIFLKKLLRFEIEAIWLQAADACDLTDEELERINKPGKRPAINESSIEEHMFNNYILSLACDWSNKRIRKHIDIH